MIEKTVPTIDPTVRKYKQFRHWLHALTMLTDQLQAPVEQAAGASWFEQLHAGAQSEAGP